MIAGNKRCWFDHGISRKFIGVLRLFRVKEGDGRWSELNSLPYMKCHERVSNHLLEMEFKGDLMILNGIEGNLMMI